MLNLSRCARTLAVVSTGLLLGVPAQLTTGAAQQTITGAWRSETSSWWTTGWTVVFDVRGNSLTGAVTNCPRAGAVESFDARIDAGTVHFKCRSEDGKRPSRSPERSTEIKSRSRGSCTNLSPFQPRLTTRGESPVRLSSDESRRALAG